MGLQHIAPQIHADAMSRVLVETWGHLAPEKDRAYQGRIVFAIGCFDNGDLNPTALVSELDGLEGSPWFCQALQDFLSGLCSSAPVEDRRHKGHAVSGHVWEWIGTFRDYCFEGRLRLLLDTNKLQA